jgi:hypothetical protein
MNCLLVIDAHEELRCGNEIPGFAIEHSDGNGLLRLRKQRAAQRSHAQYQVEPMFQLSNHDGL